MVADQAGIDNADTCSGDSCIRGTDNIRSIKVEIMRNPLPLKQPYHFLFAHGRKKNRLK
jgi:hypothetical protein